MRNFLVALVLNSEDEFFFWLDEAKTTNPDEVVCPQKTLCFFFKKGESPEKIRKNLAYLKIIDSFYMLKGMSDNGIVYMRGTKIRKEEVFNTECDMICEILDEKAIVVVDE